MLFSVRADGQLVQLLAIFRPSHVACLSLIYLLSLSYPRA